VDDEEEEDSLEALPDVDDLSDEVKAKLKAELSRPYRRLVQTLYGAVLGGGAIGLFASVPQGILSLTGAEDAQPVEIALRNLAINFAALAGGVGGLWWDNKQSKVRAHTLLLWPSRHSLIVCAGAA
jgi:hypothetical protein